MPCLRSTPPLVAPPSDHGAGFGGLNAAQTLTGQDVDVLVVDRHNFHLFSPLLYQVATSGLEPGEIASPVRGIFRDASNIRFLLGEVEDIDPAARRVTIRSKEGVAASGTTI